MAFQTRCPECEAKLRFDEAPEAEEAIECPRCGHVFDAAEAKPIPKKQKALAGGGGDDRPRRKKKKGKSGAGGEKSNVPKKRKVKIKKSNPVILWVMLIGALIVAPAIGWVGYKLFYGTGKIGGLMSYVPPDCNLMHGVDVERMGKYPGFADQLKAAMAGDFDEGREVLSKAAGASVDTFIDYAMSAKILNGSNSGAMLIFQSLEPFNVATLYTGLGGKAEPFDGIEVQKLGARTGVMNGAYVYCPTDRIMVVIVNFGDQKKMLRASLAAKNSPKEGSMQAKLGDTGKKVTRAHIWNLMRPEGDLKDRLKEQIADPLKGALPALSQKVASAKMFGCYLWFGKMIIYGAAIECDSNGSAESLAKTMKEGDQLGKGEDSDIPRDLRSIFPVVFIKEFAEFMSNLRFLSQGQMAYLESKMELAKSIQVLTYFNRPNMWEADSDGGGGLGRGRR